MPGSDPIISSEQAQLEAQRIQDVFRLLDNLARREEATVKQILGYLYDIGYTRWVNKKVPLWPLRYTLRACEPLCKPAFRFLAWRWFKKNCPRLIAEWLYSQVTFEPKQGEPDPDAVPLIDVVPVRPELPPVVEQQAAEIMALRDRVNWLTLSLITILVILGGFALLK